MRSDDKSCDNCGGESHRAANYPEKKEGRKVSHFTIHVAAKCSKKTSGEVQLIEKWER